MSPRKRHRHTWWHRHSLSIAAAALLALWFAGYCSLDPNSHVGAFYGNAIADWSGSLMIILGTKFFYEIGSRESRPFHATNATSRLQLLVREHSLLLFIGLSGIVWLVLFFRMDPGSKWGQVVGNLLSEWGQMAGLVFLTKRLVEIGSEE
jgi:hypothetical protein